VAPIAITETELLDALAAAAPSKGPSNALTLKELARQTRLDERKVRVALEQFAAEGRLQRHKIQRERLNGTPMTYVGFTIAPAKKGKR
jgi:hypothetical protein